MSKLLYDLLIETPFEDIESEFLRIYGEYDGKDYIKEFKQIYNFFRDKCEKNGKSDFSHLEIIMEENKPSDEMPLMIRNINNNTTFPLWFSWFLNPRIKVSDETLNNYKKEEILSHFLYDVGYDMLNDCK